MIKVTFLKWTCIAVAFRPIPLFRYFISLRYFSFLTSQCFVLGIYDPNLFTMNEFSNEWQFISISQDQSTQSMEDSTIIAQYNVANLQDCFSRCYQYPHCKTVGFSKNGTCKISNSGLITPSERTMSEAFYYYSAHKN